MHCIEWPLGVITAIYPDERGIVRAAEVKECGRRSICSATFLVPLELDCHQEDDVICQRLRNEEEEEEEEEEHQDNELRVDDVNTDADTAYSPVGSTSEARGQGSPTIADARE